MVLSLAGARVRGVLVLILIILSAVSRMPNMARVRDQQKLFILLILQLYPLQLEAETAAVKYLLLMVFNLSWNISIFFTG